MPYPTSPYSRDFWLLMAVGFVVVLAWAVVGLAIWLLVRRVCGW